MCGLALGCLSLRWCRIPPDLTQECVLGDDEGRIWYWPLEIVDIPSPGGTKRHFCFLWSPSSGINAASCNLSLEPSKTLRHLMTLQGRLSSLWRAGGRGRKGGGGLFKPWATVLYTYIYLQLVSLTHNLCEAISGKKTLNSSHRNNFGQCGFHPGPVHFHWTVTLSQKVQRRTPEAHREIIVHPIGRWGF